MTDFQEAVVNWPVPKAAGLPITVKKGRSWKGLSRQAIPQFIGALFQNSEAQSIRLEFKVQDDGTFSVSVMGASCPAVPYSTLSGEQLTPFMDFLESSKFELTVHSDYWFWVPGLEEEDLENLVDRFMSSL